MRIPKFAFVCCCCCTWAAASSEGLSDRDHLDFHGEFDPKFSKLSHDLSETEDNEDFDEFTLREEGEHGHSHDEDPEEEEWSKSQAWGYATLANTFCVLLSVAGIGIILCNKRASGKTMIYIYDFFIALGVSTMLGDAFLHILPAVLGLHSHDEPDVEEEDHAHEHRNEPDDHGHSHDAEPVEEPDLYMEAIKKLSVVVGIIYFFWIFEQVMSMMGHGHSHGGAAVAHDDEMATRKTISDEKEKEVEEKGSNSNQIVPTAESTDFEGEVKREQKTDWREQRSAIIGILVGDCIHNFVDGLALGTTWAKGWETGLATTIALFLHELPHELSDFTIYIKFGLSNAKALGANLFSAMFSYGGLYTGLALSSNTDASEWLLAMVAGLFVYIVLVDIIPELKLKGHFENKWTRFAIQNLGMTIGFIILAMLGVFEGRSHNHDHDDHDHDHDY